MATAEEWDWTSAYKTFYDPDDDDERKGGEAGEGDTPSRVPAAACNHDHSNERAIYDLELSFKVARMQAFHGRGTDFFEEGQYDRAFLQYKHAFVYYDYTFPVGLLLPRTLHSQGLARRCGSFTPARAPRGPHRTTTRRGR
jgi:hypothetical protein